MTFQTVLASTIAALILSAGSNAAEYTVVDAAHSKMNFRYSEMGVAIDGSFSKFNMKLNFDPARPQSAHVSADIPFAAIDAGTAEATAEVAGKDWLDTAHYPNAHFESTAVKMLSAGHYQFDGTLKIKGRARNIVVPVTFTARGAQGEFTGAFSINRSDFAIGEGEWSDTSVIDNPIKVSFKLLVSAGK